MHPLLFALLLAAPLTALAGPAAAAVTIDWVLVGDPGNAADTATNCYAADCGSVGYEYSISKYEVTNAQYAEFLNAKAASDPLGLYNPSMGTGFGGITRSGSSGSYSYAPRSGFGSRPVILVSFYDALRFANWLNNGQGSADTETGAYTITSDGILNNTITRNLGASIFLPSENEWYKAAYYDGLSATYFDYPAGTNTATLCSIVTCANCANCNTDSLTNVGAYTASPSPYGTFDQGGNLMEWNEEIVETFFGTPARGTRGGHWDVDAGWLSAYARYESLPTVENAVYGFRVASIVAAPVGQVTDVVGAVEVTGLDGVRRPLNLGDPIWKGDLIETGPGGAVELLFADNSSFALDNDARLAIDEFLYEPARNDRGEAFFSVLQGLFVYTSGLIQKNENNVNIPTPIGNIGIRGTELIGNVDPATQSQTVHLLHGTIDLRPLATGVTTQFVGPVTINQAADGTLTTSTLPALACYDGIDNDGDGLVDFRVGDLGDPGCASPTASTESPVCNNGIDDDNDGLIDITDPGCVSASDDGEFGPPQGWGCGFGPELALLIPALLAVRHRRRLRGSSGSRPADGP